MYLSNSVPEYTFNKSVPHVTPACCYSQVISVKSQSLVATLPVYVSCAEHRHCIVSVPHRLTLCILRFQYRHFLVGCIVLHREYRVYAKNTRGGVDKKPCSTMGMTRIMPLKAKRITHMRDGPCKRDFVQ